MVQLRARKHKPRGKENSGQQIKNGLLRAKENNSTSGKKEEKNSEAQQKKQQCARDRKGMQCLGEILLQGNKEFAKDHKAIIQAE